MRELLLVVLGLLYDLAQILASLVVFVGIFFLYIAIMLFAFWAISWGAE